MTDLNTEKGVTNPGDIRGVEALAEYEDNKELIDFIGQVLTKSGVHSTYHDGQDAGAFCLALNINGISCGFSIRSICIVYDDPNQNQDSLITVPSLVLQGGLPFTLNGGWGWDEVGVDFAQKIKQVKSWSWAKDPEEVFMGLKHCIFTPSVMSAFFDELIKENKALTLKNAILSQLPGITLKHPKSKL